MAFLQNFMGNEVYKVKLVLNLLLQCLLRPFFPPSNRVRLPTRLFPLLLNCVPVLVFVVSCCAGKSYTCVLVSNHMRRRVYDVHTHPRCISNASFCSGLLAWVVVQEKFNKHVQFAKSIVSALPPEEAPVDLADTHQFIKACGIFVAFNHHLDKDELRDAEETVANGYEPCSSKVQVMCGCRSQSHGRDYGYVA